MNIKIKSDIAEFEGKFIVQDAKKTIEFLVDFLIKTGIIFVCDSSFYLGIQNHLVAISDKELSEIIRMFIEAPSRAKISSSTIKETIERLRDMPEIQIDVDAIVEKNKYKVLVKNGVFNVKDGTFNPNPPKDELYFHKLNFNYIKKATIKKAPNFEYFVKTSLGEENLDCSLEWNGYSCTTLTAARKSMSFIGPEKCGKSLMIDIMEDGLGLENTSSVAFNRIGTEQSRIKYQGKIANLSREISAESLKNEDAFKSLVAGERITGRRLYENSREFKTYAKFTSASNFFPQFKHLDTAVLDRILPIYFKDRVINNVETDYELKDKILAEKDIIFSMSLDKVAGLIKSGYQFSISDRARTVLANKRIELLNVPCFIEENFELDADSVISSAYLYGLYKDWCNINAIAPEGRNTFYSKVTDYSNKIGRGKFTFGTRNLNGFKGLKYKSNYNDIMYEQSYQDSPVSAHEGGDS
ncbi:MAG: phage/plasmid primase, P4 family [Ruminococcus sp.]